MYDDKYFYQCLIGWLVAIICAMFLIMVVHFAWAHADPNVNRPPTPPLSAAGK